MTGLPDDDRSRGAPLQALSPTISFDTLSTAIEFSVGPRSLPILFVRLMIFN
jgi:hypothetical protein